MVIHLDFALGADPLTQALVLCLADCSPKHLAQCAVLARWAWVYIMRTHLRFIPVTPWNHVLVQHASWAQEPTVAMFNYLRTLDLKTVETIADSLGSFVLAVDNADEALRVCSEQFDQGLVTGLRSVRHRNAMWLAGTSPELTLHPPKPIRPKVGLRFQTVYQHEKVPEVTFFKERLAALLPPLEGEVVDQVQALLHGKPEHLSRFYAAWRDRTRDGAAVDIVALARELRLQIVAEMAASRVMRSLLFREVYDVDYEGVCVSVRSCEPCDGLCEEALRNP